MEKIKEHKLVCECGRTFKNSQALFGHYSHCEKHLGHKPIKRNFLAEWAKNHKGKNKKYKDKNYNESGNCRYCGKECKNQNSLKQHEIRCKENPNRIIIINKGNTISHTAWNKGLTKETDERVKKNGETLSKRIKEGKTTPSFKGKHHSKSTRDCMSNKAKEGIKNGTHYVWQIRNGHSYPEKLFIEMLKDKFNYIENINYETEYKINTKFADFYFKNLNLIIEIDGTQHYKTKNDIYSDIKRDNLFKKEKYNIIRIPWDNYKKNTDFWIGFINKIFSNDNLIELCRINRKFIEHKRKLTFNKINIIKTTG